MPERDTADNEPGLKTFFDRLLAQFPRDEYIIAANRGAHYADDVEFAFETRRVLRYLSGTVSKITRNPPLLIWRNTPPGHVNCTNYAAPISVQQPTAALPYHWGDFELQNWIVDNILQIEFPSVFLLDAATPTALRPDRHSGWIHGNSVLDCLHYIMDSDSPVGHWVRLLYNIIVAANTTF